MDYQSGTDRNQINIIPDTLDDYVDSNNICRVIDAFVESLNFVVLGFKHAKLSSTGRPPYHPAVLLKLFIYGMLNRIRSSRRLHAETLRNIEVMWLLGKELSEIKVYKFFAGFLSERKEATTTRTVSALGGADVAIRQKDKKNVNFISRQFLSKRLTIKPSVTSAKTILRQ